MTSCIFCRIASGEVPARLAYQDSHVVAFHDTSPQAPTHVLVIPREHVRTLADLVPEGGDGASAGSLMAGVKRTADALGRGADDGYRVVVNCGEKASQSVFHVHVHLLAGRPFGWPPG